MSESTNKVPWISNNSPGSVTEYEQAVITDLYHFINVLAAQDTSTYDITLLLCDSNNDLLTTNYGVLLTAE